VAESILRKISHQNAGKKVTKVTFVRQISREKFVASKRRHGLWVSADMHLIIAKLKKLVQPIRGPLGVKFSNFECSFNAQSSKLERLFSLKRGKRDVRALSF